jgi:DNA-binding XRE family transcriptional regulator
LGQPAAAASNTARHGVFDRGLLDKSSIDDLMELGALPQPPRAGAIIRQKRRTLGLDQKELAQRVGVNRRIVAVEQGKPRAALGLVLQTLYALGIVLGLLR